MTAVLPGSTIGILGSGQLGRMFTIAARRMGYRVHTLSPDSDSPTGQVADAEIRADWGDLAAIRDFASGVDVLTFEFENVPAEAARVAAELVPVRPDGSVLHTAQNRLREKDFLSRNGFPVAEYAAVHSLPELEAALKRIGTPAVLKSAGFGYDGKGQVRIDEAGQASSAWRSVAADEAVLEEFVDFEREVSVVAARGLDGSLADFGVIENAHCRHILDVSTAPASAAPSTAREAIRIAHAILEALGAVGVVCVEFFVARGGRVLVNEIAPRPHNSGHLTFDACVTSQFEQQLRAVCGLPLGSTRYLGAAAMANLLGDLWADGTPDWPAVCGFPDVKLHLYGKSEARPGRKMGHLTAIAQDAESARARVVAARTAALGKAGARP